MSDLYVIARLESKINVKSSQVLVKILCNNEDSIFTEYFDYSFLDEGSSKYWIKFKYDTTAKEYIIKHHLKNCIPMQINGTFTTTEDNMFHEEIISATPIDELDLSPRTYNCLRRAGIKTVGEILKYSDEDFYKIRCFGAKCLKEIKEKLAEYRI